MNNKDLTPEAMQKSVNNLTQMLRDSLTLQSSISQIGGVTELIGSIGAGNTTTGGGDGGNSGGGGVVYDNMNTSTDGGGTGGDGW
jgi:hypothetical protein